MTHMLTEVDSDHQPFLRSAEAKVSNGCPQKRFGSKDREQNKL